MEVSLQKIREFADEAHGKQQRKYAPERYIVHPVRVMELCQKHTSQLPVLAAALLHDVLEDTPVTKEKLARFLSTVMTHEEAGETLRLVVELTDVYTKQRHPRLNRKKRKAKESLRIEKTSADSQTVRYADIIDNCSEIVEHDRDFARLFLQECKALLTVIPKGDASLRQEAVETVDRCLKEAAVDSREDVKAGR